MGERLKGKVAVVTGGASGIGAATCRLFVQEGARVIVADIQEPLDDGLKTLLRDSPDKARFQKCDVTSEADVRSSVEAAVSNWGRLDAAVACAGVPGQGKAVDITAEQWDFTFAVNARGVFFLTKYAVPEMIKAGGGSIINISSAFGIVAGPSFSAYTASKAAVRNFCKSTALDYMEHGIRSNSIHPGVIQTPMLQGMIDRSGDPMAARGAFDALQPGGKGGVPEDIGWGCVYLASDESRFVNGTELVIDGGLLAR